MTTYRPLRREVHAVLRDVPCVHCESPVACSASFNPRDAQGPAYFGDVIVGDCPLGCVLSDVEEQQMLDRATSVYADELTAMED